MLWLIIVGAILIAAVWPLVLVLTGPLWVAILVTALVLLTITLVFVAKLLRSRMRAAALERELLRQAELQAQKVRPDRRPEILALQKQMKDALDSLKNSKLAGGGKAALYALPWYVIIGPPAAGKTTALGQSGLGFITPAGSSGHKFRGTAGTRNCDWWFSKHAILLDTAGRLATEQDDREEWNTFLDTVRRFRPGRPLDGVVVAFSVEDLLTQTEEQQVETVSQLRARADELMARLEMVLPVYVLFTKVDLLPGFVEFFGDLSSQQRAQAWGVSFALDDPRMQEPLAAVEAEFKVLTQSLHTRMLDRLAREPQTEARAKIVQFPQEFRPLRAPVARFIEELGRPNPYSETPFVRGFYFSSGTQTGRSIDRLLNNMARGFSLGMMAQAETRPKEAKSYFVTELFSKVIFPDRHLAVRSQSQERRSTRNLLILAGATLLTALCLLTPAATSYITNNRLVRETDRDLREARALERKGEATEAANGLDLLLERILQLEEASGKFAIYGFWGPYTAPRLKAATEQIYRERLRAMVEGPVQHQLAADVRSIGDLVRTDSRNFQRAYNDLKLYLMLCRPQHLEIEYAKPKLAEVWARAYNSRSEKDQHKLELHAGRYLEIFKADPNWAWKAEESGIAVAQGRLSGLPVEDLQYAWLTEAAEGVPPIRPDKIFFGASAQYFTAKGNAEVPGMYTALGWEKVRRVLESPDNRLEFEPWVLGRTDREGTDSKQSSASRQREIYFQRYVAAWSDFLVALDVVPPQNIASTLEELRVLTETDGPYVRLFRVVRENVRLEMGDSSLLAKGKEKAKAVIAAVVGADAGAPPPREISSVERHFTPLLHFASGSDDKSEGGGTPSGLNQYLAHLGTLEVSVTQLAESQQTSSAELGNELSRTAAAVQRMLGGTDPRTRMILEPLLMNPIRGSRKGVVNADYAQLSGDWKSAVWELFRTKIKPRYPFSSSQSEVSLPEFTEFFRPQTGILWAFVEKNFAARLERSGKDYVPKPSGEGVPYRSDFLSCLNVSQQITEAVFGTGQEPSVPFSVKIESVSPNVSEVSLVVDGKAAIYRNEPERWIPVIWPGTETPRGGTLRVKGAGFNDEIPRVGDFGLFRLFSAGGLDATGKLSGGVPELAASWSLSRSNEPPVKVTVKPSRSVHPFVPNFFSRLNCPPEVTVGAAAAGAP
jgi:type VI secretion system protein ImpL